MIFRLLFIATICICTNIFSLQAQKKDVYVQINRLIDSTKLYQSKVYKTWNDAYYTLERSEFYMSEFTLYSKNDSLVLNDLVVLSNFKNFKHAITSADFDTITAVKFHIGVPERLNHLDPSSYSAEHPLSPKVPSMHWGWSSGYRFFVFEGYCDIDNNFSMDRWANYHAVGNSLYKPIKVEVTPQYQGDSIVLYLDMDHKKLYEGLDITKDLEEHGEGALISKILNNLRKNDVFTGGDAVFFDDPSSINEGQQNSEYETNVFPSPANDFVVFNSENQGNDAFDVAFYDLTGKHVLSLNQVSSGSQNDISVLNEGIYSFRISYQYGIVEYGKIVVTE